MGHKMVSILIALSLLGGMASAASAACTVTDWTDGRAGHPIFECDNNNNY
jgi:hypothetical protein